MREKCGECYYEEGGECKRNAPSEELLSACIHRTEHIVDVDNSYITRWPRVNFVTDWCGEWRKK